MSDMMDDIEKYSKIWDAALEKGIFPDSPKPVVSDEDSFFGADFFGQNRSTEYDVDAPMNEVDAKYWDTVSRMADHSKKYIDPLIETESIKDVVNKMAGSNNPVEPMTIGKDQNLNVTQNWGVGGKEVTQLEELKVRLEKLESKLNAIESEGNSGKTTQDKIDSLKNQIDNLSDSLSGDRFSDDG